MSLHVHRDAPPEGRHVAAAIVAAVVSLVLHLVLYETVGERRMSLFDLDFRDSESRQKRQRLATRAEIAPLPPPAPIDPLRTAGATGGSGVGDPASLLDRLAQPSAASIFEPPPAAPETSLSAAPVEPLTPPPAPDLPVWVPRQEILSILDAAARDHRAPIPRREIARIERQPLAPDISASYDLLAGLPKMTAATALPAITSPVAVSLTPPTLEPGGDAALPEPELGPEAEGDASTKVVAELPAAVAPAYPIEDRLRIAVTAYDAESADGHRYFQIDVFRKDAQALPVLPRDVVFVQDTSASLGERYLNPCRTALRAAIAALGPEDRFNVVRFSQDVVRCFPEWAAPGPETLAQADAFVGAMVAGGNTDLFASMAEVLHLPRTPGRPVIAVVVTDGNVTAGQLERDSQIIGTFSRLNAGAVSVFTVGTSPRANVYLLDMLSYANRGAMTAVAPDRFSVSRTIEEAIRTVRRPLLADVRFNFDVVSGAKVYPTLTTNLYEDRPLRLVGRVRSDQKMVAFQARGEALGKRYDMLFEVDLEGAGVKPGPRELATLWATQRMYDLVSRFASTEDASLIDDMHRLGAEFDIPVPYTSRLAP